jgi:hypothetical protein
MTLRDLSQLDLKRQQYRAILYLAEGGATFGSSRDFCGFLFRGPKRAHVQVTPESPVLRGP